MNEISRVLTRFYEVLAIQSSRAHCIQSSRTEMCAIFIRDWTDYKGKKLCRVQIQVHLDVGLTHVIDVDGVL